MEKCRALVTGGAGFIGSHIVDALVEAGHEVTIFDCLDPQVHPGGQVPDYLNPAARMVQGDVRDYDALRKEVLGADIIFHEASAVGMGQSMYEIKKYVDVNDGGTANLLDILVNNKHTVRKLVVAASMSSYGEGKYTCKKCGVQRPPLRAAETTGPDRWEPPCPVCGAVLDAIPTDEDAVCYGQAIYALTKKDQEDMVLSVGRTYDIPAVALRYFNVYGPRQSLSNPYTGVCAIFMSRIKNDHPPVVYEDGEQTRDFVSVHDVVQANMLAMEKDEADGHAFNVGSGVPLKIKDVAAILARLYGKDIMPEIAMKFRKGDVRHCYADITKIRDRLGFEPATSFDSGMQELIDWSRHAESVDMFDSAEAELRQKGIV